MMICYGDRIRAQEDAWYFFKAKYSNHLRLPVSQSPVGEIEDIFVNLDGRQEIFLKADIIFSHNNGVYVMFVYCHFKC